jgi:hypothetical protein
MSFCNVHGHDGERGAVHRHGDRHFVQRDAVEQDFHVLDRVDGHTSLADVADNARMVGVIASVGGEVERDGQARLAGLEVTTVEGVGLFGRRETGVLAHGPGTSGVHRGAGAANVGRHAGQCPHMVEAFEVLGGVQGLYGDALGRIDRQVIERLVAALFG